MRDCNNKQAFTLAEMMVVLLILSIVAAAALPVMTRQSKASSASGLWSLVETGPGAYSDIYSRLSGDQGVAIGATALGGNAAKLFINTLAGGSLNHIMFAKDGVLTGQLKVEANNNIGLGLNSLNALSTGSNNLAVGTNALLTISTASNNTAFGQEALTLNTAANNTAFGYQALTANTLGTNNTAFGYNSLVTNSTASNNTAFGHAALTLNAAANNTAFGYKSLTANTSGTNNTAVGYNSLVTSSTANNSTAFGYEALKTSNAANNTAFGYIALTSINTGANNTAFGYQSLGGTASGNGNTAVGYQAMGWGVGNNNTGIGYGSCANTTSDGNTCIGAWAGISAGVWQATAIGTEAAATVSNTIVLGKTTLPPAVIIPGTLSIGGANVVNTAGTWTTSDRRLKFIKGEFAGGLQQLRNLKTYNYTFKNDKNKTPRVGVTAQNLQQVFPAAVTKGEKSYLMIRQEDMFYAMLNSIKELDIIVQNLAKDIKAVVAKVKTLDDKVIALFKVDQANAQKIKALEKQNKALEARLAKLEKRVK